MTFANGSETYVSQPNRSTYTSIPRGRLDYPCYAEYLTDDVNADNGPWPEVVFVTFTMGSETCVSQPNRSTSTPVPYCKLDYTCHAEYIGDNVNTGNGP